MTSESRIKCVDTEHFNHFKIFDEGNTKMSERRISFLERELRRVKELLEDSDYENDRLRRQLFHLYEELQDLKDEYQDFKKEHQKLKEKIQEKNLTSELLENLEGLTIQESGPREAPYY